MPLSTGDRWPSVLAVRYKNVPGTLKRTTVQATCTICRRHRPVLPERRVCRACAVGITHTCPICLSVIPGGGQAPCTPCSHRRRSERRIVAEAATIPHPWLAKLFTGFCTSGRIPLVAGVATARIARAAAAFRLIAGTVENPKDLTTEGLHAALGAEGLRRVAPLIAYMTEIGALTWDRARLQTLIEGDRVAAILEAHRDSRQAKLLGRYRDHLASRDRKPVTQRTALTAAVALLAELGDAPLHDLSQQHLAKALRKRPGHKAALRGFLSFVAASGGPNLVPAKTRRPDVVAQERRLRADIRAWRKRLESPRSAAEARALVAMLIARVSGLPLTRVLALRRAEVAISATCVVLWPNADALPLGGPLADAFHRWTATAGPWVFPGRHGHQPLSEAAVDHHLKSSTEADRCLRPLISALR